MPFYFSNTSTKVWAECERKLYWTNLWGGTGLTTPYVDADLLYGAALHEIIPTLWAGDLSTVGAARADLQRVLLADPGWEPRLRHDLREEKATEWGRLLEAHAGVLVAHMLPLLKRQYRLVQAEISEQKAFPHDGVLLAKPDTLLEPLTGDGLVYLEWKTAAAFTDDWKAQWTRNPQAWTGAITARESHQTIAAFRVCGILKGGSRSEGEGETAVKFRTSPLLWAYQKGPEAGTKRLKVDETTVTDAEGGVWSWVGTTAKGWTCRSTDEFPGGVAAWIAALPPEVVSAQATLTDPFIIDWELAEEWARNQRRMLLAVDDLRMADFVGDDEVYAAILQTQFPRQFHQCHAGKFGKPCAMREVCFNPVVAAAPLDYGYVPRVSHHAIERAAQAKERR